jgi:N-ethylmaleimide reductase
MSSAAGRLQDSWTAPILGPLQSRVVMTAMTRNFADARHCATSVMAEYYARRAAHGVGLILTEGTIVHPSGDGYRSVPYIFDQEQTASWRRVTDRVHAEGGRIFSQLWHCGRISHPEFLGGRDPVSATDRAAQGVNRQNDKPYGVPRRLRVDELPAVYEIFRHAARNALTAGFDGVELHLGHGYLPDQVFDARGSDRDVASGGSVENRCRFGLELTRAVLDECGPARVIARISPSRFMQELYDWPDLDEMIGYLIPAFDGIGLRMLDISGARSDYFETSGRVIRQVRPLWPYLLIGGASLPADQAQAELDAGLIDLVTYGRWLIANPDLVARFRCGVALRPYDRAMLDQLE